MSLQVLSCVTAVVSHDLSAKVRRAAILVLEMMFKGLGNACLKVSSPNLIAWNFDLLHGRFC